MTPPGANDITCREIFQIAVQWKLHPTLVGKLLFIVFPLVLKRIGRNAQILSGARTCAEQSKLTAEGYQTASCALSTHVAPYQNCGFATGVDIGLGFHPSGDQKLAVGAIVEMAGLRWGGGAKRDSRGIPEGNEWAHIDMGPV